MTPSTLALFDRARDVLRLAAHYHAGAFEPVSWDTMHYLRPYILEGTLPPGPLPVWNGAADDTIWGCPGDNYAFRAWHDRAHAICRGDFDANGESATLEVQRDQLGAFCQAAGTPASIREAADALLVAEIRGQVAYHARHGVFPVRQKAFALAFLCDQQAAVATVFH